MNDYDNWKLSNDRDEQAMIDREYPDPYENDTEDDGETPESRIAEQLRDWQFRDWWNKAQWWGRAQWAEWNKEHPNGWSPE